MAKGQEGGSAPLATLKHDLPILILAAGQSARMRGADKLAERVDGIPLLTAQSRKALATGHPVLVALPSLDHPRVRLLDNLPVTRITVPGAAEGMGGSLRNAVAQLPDCAAFMILLADLPEITTSDLETLIAASAANPGQLIWRGATQSGAPGHPIILDASLRPAFATLTGDHGGESIIRPRRNQTLLVPLPAEHARRDLDTPEDWATWRAETGR